jgi:hypothetical protein
MKASAEQPAITAFHCPNGILNEPYCLAADRGGLPGIASDSLRAEERIGDLSIAGASEVAVERAQHERQTSEVTRGDAPALRQWAGGASRKAPLKTNERSDPKGEAIVEDDHCRQLVAYRGAGKPQAMIAVSVLDQEVKAIGALQS